jgi:general secretion pathway protein L
VSTVLRLYVGEHWPQRAKLSWALLASDGAPLQEGESDPGHWPRADECEAVLSGAQGAWLRTRLPEHLPRGEASRLLANALEEKLMDEPERHHLTVTDRRNGEVGVLVIARERLREIVKHLAALGRPLSRAYSELQTAPGDAQGWHLAFGTDAAILRRGLHNAAPLDVRSDGSPPALLVALAAAGRASADPAPIVTIHCRPGDNAPGASAWEKALQLQVRPGAAYRWFAIDADSANLLHSEFAPSHRRREWLRRTKPALWLAGVVVAMDVALGAAQVGWQRYQLTGAEQRVAQMFQEAFPNVPVIDATAQIKRQLDPLRSSRGLLRSDDALALLADLADVLGSDGRDAMQELRFSEGVREVAFSPAIARKQLGVRGLDAVSAAQGGAPRLTIRREKGR